MCSSPIWEFVFKCFCISVIFGQEFYCFLFREMHRGFTLLFGLKGLLTRKKRSSGLITKPCWKFPARINRSNRENHDICCHNLHFYLYNMCCIFPELTAMLAHPEHYVSAIVEALVSVSFALPSQTYEVSSPGVIIFPICQVS